MNKTAGAGDLSVFHDVRTCSVVLSSYVVTKATVLEEYEFCNQEQK